MFFAYNPVTATGLYLNTIFVRINVRTRSFDQRTGGGQHFQLEISLYGSPLIQKQDR